LDLGVETSPGAWFAHVPAWLMVLFRITGIFLLSPLFSMSTIPMQVKALLAAALAVAVYPLLLLPESGAAPLSIGAMLGGELSWAMLPGLVGAELLIGALIGYAAMLPINAMELGGRVMDQQMGLGLAGVFNPELGEQTGLVSDMLHYLAIAVFLILGGHRVLLMLLVDSFVHVPMGGFQMTPDILAMLVGLLTVAFELALRVAAPLLCIVMLETAAMGFVARTVPQMNILSIGFAVRIVLGGLMLLVAAQTAPYLIEEGLVHMQGGVESALKQQGDLSGEPPSNGDVIE